MARAITWWGHATALLEAGGARLLTDPLLRPRLAHLTRRGPAPDLAAVGPVDAVLVSHAHRDHLDLPSLRALGGGVPIVAPPGAARHLRALGDVHELGPGESATVAGVTIAATPALHRVRRGGRTIPAVGFVVDDDLYFAGDTDLFDAMGGLGPLELAAIPVWGWGTSLGGGGHLDPERAARAAALLRPRVAVPIHWGTYFPAHRGRGGHPLLETPPHDFARHTAALAPQVDVRILEPGQRLELGRRADG